MEAAELTFQQIAEIMTDRGDPMTARQCKQIHNLAIRKMRKLFTEDDLPQTKSTVRTYLSRQLGGVKE